MQLPEWMWFAIVIAITLGSVAVIAFIALMSGEHDHHRAVPTGSTTAIVASRRRLLKPISRSDRVVSASVVMAPSRRVRA